MAADGCGPTPDPPFSSGGWAFRSAERAKPSQARRGCSVRTQTLITSDRLSPRNARLPDEKKGTARRRRGALVGAFAEVAQRTL